jgi:hypothetical protein
MGAAVAVNHLAPRGLGRESAGCQKQALLKIRGLHLQVICHLTLCQHFYDQRAKRGTTGRGAKLPVSSVLWNKIPTPQPSPPSSSAQMSFPNLLEHIHPPNSLFSHHPFPSFAGTAHLQLTNRLLPGGFHQLQWRGYQHWLRHQPCRGLCRFHEQQRLLGWR